MKTRIELYIDTEHDGKGQPKDAKRVTQEIAKTTCPADTMAEMIGDNSLSDYIGQFANEYGYLQPQFKDQKQFIAELLAYIRLVDPEFKKEFVGDFHPETCEAGRKLQKKNTTNHAILEFGRYFESFNLSEFMKLAISKFPKPKRKDFDTIIPQLVQAALEQTRLPLPWHRFVCSQVLRQNSQTSVEQLMAKSLFIPADKKAVAVSSLSKGINELTRNLQLYLIAWRVAQESWKNFAQTETTHKGSNRALRLFNPDEKERFAKIRSGVVTQVAKDEYATILLQSESAILEILAAPDVYVKSHNKGQRLNSQYVLANSASKSP